MALGTYNRTRANLTGGAMMYGARYRLQGSLTASMDIGVIFPGVYRFRGEMAASLDLWWGYDEKQRFAAALEGSADAHTVLSPQYGLTAEMDWTANPQLAAAYRMAGGLEWAGSPYMLLTPVWGVLGGALTVSISSMQTKETVMSFPSLFIPAGGVLVIDSENCVILLNGMNVIDQYEGDWFWLTRNLQQILTTRFAGGEPQVSVLYRERYL